MTAENHHRPWLKSYPAWLPTELEPPTCSILDLFLKAVSDRSSRPGIHYFGQSISYQTINEMATALATGLKEIGIGPGDRVIVVMQNIPQAVFTCLAIWMNNAVVVPLNPMYTGEDLKHYIDDCGACLVICQDNLYTGRVGLALEAYPGLHAVTTSALDFLGSPRKMPVQFKGVTKQRISGTTDLMDLVERHAGQTCSISHPGPQDLAYLVYTSGTTGPAKGAMIRHSNVIHNAVVYEKACRLDENDVVLGVAPLFHITGIVAHVAIAFHLGLPVVMTARFDVHETLRLIEKYRVTFTVAAITVYIAILNHPGRQDFELSSFTKAYSGGAPVSPSMAKRFKKDMGLTIYNAYGLTESSSPATITPLGMEGPVDSQSGALSVGLVIPGHDAWIVNLEDPDTELEAGETGELVLRGPGITDGYWKKPEETAGAIISGRFFTGDVAKFDTDGWCFIVDRKKDQINVSGYKVWPREVEDVLYQHPSVKEAAVIGVPDAYRGETVMAYVAVRDDYNNKISPHQLICFCREKMAVFKCPRKLEIIDEIPKTPTGKFLRRQLREDSKKLINTKRTSIRIGSSCRKYFKKLFGRV